MLFDPGPFAPYGALVLVLAVFALFLSERLAAEVVALCGVAVALLFGMVAVEDVLKALGNPAPATIGAEKLVPDTVTHSGSMSSSDVMFGAMNCVTSAGSVSR